MCGVDEKVVLLLEIDHGLTVSLLGESTRTLCSQDTITSSEK